MQNTAEKKERAALAGLAAANMDERERSTEISMAELAALVETAGGEPVARFVQTREAPDPAFFLGEGKAAELASVLPDVLQDGDLLLMMGAGDIGAVAAHIAVEGFQGEGQA